MPLVPMNAVVTLMDHGGRPYGPTLDGPNSKTMRSIPGWCAARIAVICACAVWLPPLWLGQVTGVDAWAWLALADGLGVGEGVGRAIVGVALGAALVVAGVVVGTAIGRGTQAPTTTTAIATARAPMSRTRPITLQSLTESRQLVDNRYKHRADLYAERTSR